MEYMTGKTKKEELSISDILTCDGKVKEEYKKKNVKVEGAVHIIRDMGEVSFIILRKSEGCVQCVCDKKQVENFHDVKENSTVIISGILNEEERAPFGFEVAVKEINILTSPKEPMPIQINKWKMTANLETLLNQRMLTLRNIRERAKFKIQEGIVRGFREYLYSQNFTEVRTPKIVAKGAEGGANIFKLEYFGKKAELAQSPQFYKQAMVGVYDRVFEVAPVFRAEKHSTHRHLNEYTSMDFEMGYIKSFKDIMEMEAGMLSYVMKLLKEEYSKELNLLNVMLPDVEKIPTVKFTEAKELVSKKYNREIRNPFDLEPEEESLIGRYFKEEYDSDFVFVTHYPSKKRPFYAMDDPEDARFTLSFDLLFRGIEITTGGQRIHDYDEIRNKMEKRGMTGEGMDNYLDIFKYGMPPHGGLGIGLERLTMKLLGYDNVRETTMFPRDLNRLVP